VKAVRVLMLLMLGTAVSRVADASPITISAGTTLTFNFDLTGKLPPPPYDAIDFLTNIDPASLDAGDSGVFRLFNESDGIGYSGDSFFKQTFESVSPGLLDGVFSETITVTAGSIVVEPVAQGVVFNTGATPLTPGVLTPEPATWTLVSLGFAGVGALRWRTRRRS
jgi:hypothetical protein